MDIQLSWLGMGLIVISWIVQICLIIKSDKKISPVFAILQAIGIAFLVASLYISTNGVLPVLAYLNVLSAFGALTVFGLALKK